MRFKKPLSIAGEDYVSNDEHQRCELGSDPRPRRAAPILVAPSPSQFTTALGSIIGAGKRLRSPYEPECQGPLPQPEFIGTKSENSGGVFEKGGGGESLNNITIGHSSGGGNRYVSILRLPKMRRTEDANKSSSSVVSMPPNASTVLRPDLNRLGVSLSRVEEQLEQQHGAIKKLERNSSEFTETLPGKLDAFRGEVTSRIVELTQGQGRLQREVSSIQCDVSALKTSLASMHGCIINMEGSVQQLMVTLGKIMQQPNQKQFAMNAASPELASSTNPPREATTSITEADKPAFGNTPFSFSSTPSTTPNNFDFSNSTKPAGTQPLPFPFSTPQEADKGQNSKPAADLSPPPRATTESAASGNSSKTFPNPFMKPNTTPAPASDDTTNAQGATYNVKTNTAVGVFSVEPASSGASSTPSGSLFGTSSGMPNPFGGGGAFTGVTSTGATASISQTTSSFFSGDKPKPPAEGSDGHPHSVSTNQSDGSAQPSSRPFSFGKPALPGAAASPPPSAGKAPPGPFSFSPAGVSAESSNTGGVGGTASSAPVALPGFSYGSAVSGSTGSPFGSAFPSTSQAPIGGGTVGDTASSPLGGVKGLGTASVTSVAPAPSAAPSFGFGVPPTSGGASTSTASPSPFASNMPPSGTFGGGAGNSALGTASPFSFGGNPSGGAGAPSTFGSTALVNTPFGTPASNATGNGIGGGFAPVTSASMVPSFATAINNTLPFGSGGGTSSGLDGGANGSQILGTKKRRVTNRRY